MTIITQDGRKLTLNKGDKFRFNAVNYAGRSVIKYVDIRLFPAKLNKKGYHAEFNITLGEYVGDHDTAFNAAKALSTAANNGDEIFIMPGFEKQLPNDNLNETILKLHDFMAPKAPLGYYFNLATVNALTASPRDFIPDANGHYRVAALQDENPTRGKAA